MVSKILEKIVIDRIRRRIDCSLRKEQAGFRSGSEVTEQIFILRNILEQAPLYIYFVNFERDFVSVHRNSSLWVIMKQYGFPQNIAIVVKVLYDGFQCAVVDEEATSEWFKITMAVK